LAVSLLSRQKPIDSFRLQTEQATLWIKSSRWAVCCLSGGCQTQGASEEKLGKREISSPFRLVSSPCDRRWIISIRLFAADRFIIGSHLILWGQVIFSPPMQHWLAKHCIAHCTALRAEHCSEQCNERATDTLQHCAHSALRRLQSGRAELGDRSWPDDCLRRLAATAPLPAAHAGWPIGAAEEAGKQTKAKSRTKANEIREQRERSAEETSGYKW